MEASVRLFNSTNLRHHLPHSILTRHSLKFPPRQSSQITINTLRNPNHPLFSNSLIRFQASRIRSPSAFLSQPSLPWSNPNQNPLGILLSLAASRLLSSSVPKHQPNHVDSDPKESYFSWNRAPEGSDGRDLGLVGKKSAELTVVLLGWLGAEPKHLKRYAELYTSIGIHAITFVCPVRDVLSFDLGRRVERRISGLAEGLVSWLSEQGENGRERCLLFHTFSNTGWLAYGAVLDHLQSRGDFMGRIKGCTIDSGGDPEINPQVWAAGFSAALLRKRSSATLPSVGFIEGQELQTDKGVKVEDNGPLLIEVWLLAFLEMLFSFILKLPDVNRRLSKIISILTKNQPPCPQLYLYSTADKVIPSGAVEMFINEQKMLGKKVWGYNFGTSPHVDHFRSFPHIYSVELHKFIKECLTSDRQNCVERLHLDLNHKPLTNLPVLCYSVVSGSKHTRPENHNIFFKTFINLFQSS